MQLCTQSIRLSEHPTSNMDSSGSSGLTSQRNTVKNCADTPVKRKATEHGDAESKRPKGYVDKPPLHKLLMKDAVNYYQSVTLEELYEMYNGGKGSDASQKDFAENIECLYSRRLLYLHAKGDLETILHEFSFSYCARSDESNFRWSVCQSCKYNWGHKTFTSGRECAVCVPDGGF